MGCNWRWGSTLVDQWVTFRSSHTAKTWGKPRHEESPNLVVLCIWLCLVVVPNPACCCQHEFQSQIAPYLNGSYLWTNWNCINYFNWVFIINLWLLNQYVLGTGLFYLETFCEKNDPPYNNLLVLSALEHSHTMNGLSARCKTSTCPF